MAKKGLTGASVRERIEGRQGAKPSEEEVVVRDPAIDLDRVERIAVVCRLFCQGFTISEIRKRVSQRFGPIRREEPYTMLHYAASHGWLTFRPPHRLEYAKMIRDHYSWLRDVEVTQSPMIEDVAQSAAEMLLRIVKETTKRKERLRSKERDVVRVGFSGGVAVAHLARAFSDVLCRPTPGLPKKIVFHSIVAGLSPTDPYTDPNAFFTHFRHRKPLQVEAEFLALHAPAIVLSAGYQSFFEQDDIKLAKDWANYLDVVVTSGADWKDDDSLLSKRMKERDEKGWNRLRKLGVEGDVMWRPLAAGGPVDDETGLRALTMKELRDLPDFIENKKGSVLLMMGPCAGCQQHKGRFTKIVLDLPDPILTHVCLDSRSAAHIVTALGGVPEPPAPRRHAHAARSRS